MKKSGYSRTAITAVALVLLGRMFLPGAPAQAANSQAVCVTLFVGTSTDDTANANCPQPAAPATTTPTTTPETPPGGSVTGPSAGGGYVLQNISDVQLAFESDAVLITWRNPDDPLFEGVRILRSPYGFPADPFSGKVVYQGAGNYLRDTGGIPGQMYYYSAFSYDGFGHYSSGTIFSLVWPSPQFRTNTSGVANGFPFGSSAGSSTPLASGGATSPGGTALSFVDVDFIQVGNFITPLTVNGARTVPVVGTLPLLVVIPNSVIGSKIPGGLAQATMSIDVLGKYQSYLIRYNSFDDSFESDIDLSTIPPGGYPFYVKIDAQNGREFALKGILAVTQNRGSGVNFTFVDFLWILLLLLILILLIVYLVYRPRDSEN